VDSDFGHLMATCAKVAARYPDLIFIGGVAVYLHAVNHADTRVLAEATHDADLYISLADMADLRDDEQVTSNRRLSKSQFIKDGWEFDVYTERLAELIVPFDRVSAESIEYGGLRVASLAHLLVLKAEAACDRAGSAKGEKDIRDLFRIAAVAKTLPFDAKEASAFLSDRHLDLLARAAKQHGHALGMAAGNAQAAKRLRENFGDMLGAIASADEPSPRPRGPKWT
jgi:hypothetical protein